MSVDLPAPLWPSTATTSPGWRLMLTPSTAFTPPKALRISRSSTRGVEVSGVVIWLPLLWARCCSGLVQRPPGTPLRECPPGFALLLYFAAGSTRCPVHLGTLWVYR